MSAVWVVRNRHGDIVSLELYEPYEQPDGWTVTAAALASVADVLQSAEAMADLMRRTGWRGEFTVEYLDARDWFIRAVATLREQEGA